jgi:hypothetical protein
MGTISRLISLAHRSDDRQSAQVDLGGSILEAEHSGAQLPELLHTPGVSRGLLIVFWDGKEVTGLMMCHSCLQGSKPCTFPMGP